MAVATLAALVTLLAGHPAAAYLAPPTAEQQQAMLGAVRQMLEAAHVQPQDLPKRIIAVQDEGGGKYRVHMEMVQGDGWFELRWDGQRWSAAGVSPPPAPPSAGR
jgi:hypothetical protein